MRRYLRALRHRDFALLWGGATLSALGDGMSLVALMWLVFEQRGSAFDLGLLTACYTAPVIVGGFVAGYLLDRFDRRSVLVADTAARALVMGSVPALAWLGVMPDWYPFLAAAVYGLLKMVPLAGVPSMVPALVPGDDLTTANAMETVSYGVGGILGPALAGVLVAVVGAPAVVGIDALTYVAFLGALLAIRHREPARAHDDAGAARSYGPALRVFASSPPILATTLMFMAFNVGEGILSVFLPVYAVASLGLGAAGFGLLVAASSVGVLASALVVGGSATPWRVGRAIALLQAVAGLLLLALVVQPPLAPALVIVLLFGACASPLTIWAQTIRMRIIPPELRGRVFALLRTMMQSTPPAGGFAAGLLLEGAGLAPAIVVAAAVIAVPGVVGLLTPALNEELTPVPAVAAAAGDGART